MADRPTDEISRWLAAERLGAFDEADAELAALFSRHVPMLNAPAGLADRIVAEAMPRRSPAMEWLDAWWTRAAVVAMFLAVGVALALVTPAHAIQALSVGAQAFVRLLHGAATACSVGVGMVVAAWSLILTLGRAAVVVSSTGMVPAVVLANALLALGAYIGFAKLLTPREECH